MKRSCGFFLALSGLIGCTSAIMCYECNSVTDPRCSEGVLPYNLRRNCTERDRGVKHTLCRKIVQYVDNEISERMPKHRVVRACGWDESKYKTSCYQRSGFGSRQEICSCVTDYCNASDLPTMATTLLINLIMLKIVL